MAYKRVETGGLDSKGVWFSINEDVENGITTIEGTVKRAFPFKNDEGKWQAGYEIEGTLLNGLIDDELTKAANGVFLFSERAALKDALRKQMLGVKVRIAFPAKRELKNKKTMWLPELDVDDAQLGSGETIGKLLRAQYDAQTQSNGADVVPF